MPISAHEADAFFEVDDIVAGYGGLDVLQGVSLEVQPREVVCIVGPNGSGKSTLMKAIYGLIGVKSGTIRFQGGEITHRRPEEVLGTGIGIVPQLPTVFPNLTVRDNLELGMYTVRDKARIRRRIDEVLDRFPALRDLRSRRAGVLSGGERRALEIARALMLEPALVLMDEPSAGLSPALTTSVFDQIRALNDSGVAFLLVEQNARQGLEASHRAYVMEMGRVRYTDESGQLLRDETIRRLFFPAAI